MARAALQATLPRSEVRAEKPSLKLERLAALDVVRSVTAIGVIATHTTQALAGISITSVVALAALHATRHVFFLVSGMALVYAHYEDRRFSTLRFWRDRLWHIGVPYLVWTLVYYVASSTKLAGIYLDLTLRPSPNTFGNELHQLFYLLWSGTGHLYFIVVLLQFYVVFPVVLFVLRKTHRWHLLLFAASLVVQVWLDYSMRHGELPGMFTGTSANRQLALYEFYLIGGGIIGAHAKTLERYLREFSWAVAIACAALCVGIEARDYLQLHNGVIGTAGGQSPFAPYYIPFDLAAFVLVYLVGVLVVDHCGPAVRRVFASASECSYGVYLMHPLLLDTFTYLWLAPMARAGDPRPLLIIVGVLLVSAAAFAGTAILSRTPISPQVIDRPRRPITGGPPPVGRGRRNLGHLDLAGLTAGTPSVA